MEMLVGKSTDIRTHEATLRELTIDVDGTKELLSAQLNSLKVLIDERDRLYKERDDARRTAVDAALAAAKAAVDAALIAVKEQTKASFEASEKAIVKAEEAQKSYNTSHNDLARKMDEQSKATMPRPETETRFRGLEEKFASLKDIVTAAGSMVIGAKEVKVDNRANIGVIIAVIMAGIALVGFVLNTISHLK